MINNNISFGKKIPLTTCQIQDKKTGKFVPATLFEYDCKDEQDILELVFTGNQWYFSNSIVKNMGKKFELNKLFTENPLLKRSKFRKEPKTKDDYEKRFFSMQLEDGKTIGICQGQNKDLTLKLDYLESQNTDHRFVGTTILASLGIKTLQEGNNSITIDSGATEAEDFYTDKCGFRHYTDDTFKLDKRHIKKLIKNTIKETKSPIVDLQV